MCADPDCFSYISGVDLTLNPTETYCRRCKLRSNNMKDNTKNALPENETIWYEARAIIEHFEVKQINHEPITDKDLLYVNEMLETVARLATSNQKKI